MSMKIRFDWFKQYGIWQLSSPYITIFKSTCTCFAICLIFFTIEFWFGSQENLKEV